MAGVHVAQIEAEKGDAIGATPAEPGQEWADDLHIH
jgi:hypothetical protein